MKKMLVTIAGGLLLASTAAIAGAPQHHRGPPSHQTRGNNGRHDPHHAVYTRDRYGEHDTDGRYYVAHDRGRHEGWYKKGGYVPSQYRTRRYIVTDWRIYHLRQPPRGYAWVRSDNDQYLLIALATGLIAEILSQ
jgi:Ni/Co efflux regulator RcnB